MKEPLKKKVDNEWKKSAQKKKEKDNKKEEKVVDKHFPEVSFLIHISQLAMQSMVFLGLIDHPKGEKMEIDLLQSKYLIDTIDMLYKKCKEKLSPEEENGISSILYDLRLKYLDAEKKHPEKSIQS